MEKEKKEKVAIGKSDLLNKMKGLKKDQLVIILLVGLLLVIIAIPTKKGDSEKATALISGEMPAVDSQNQSSADSTLELQLEKRLEEILSTVKGVGNVNVMITIKSKGEKIVEKDIPRTEKTSVETDSQGGVRNTKEIISNEMTIYLENANGHQVPYVVKELEPQIQGVVVTAEGANNPVVVREILEAIMALFQVEAHKIKVMKMG
jgi:hypothetical protein